MLYYILMINMKLYIYLIQLTSNFKEMLLQECIYMRRNEMQKKKMSVTTFMKIKC